MTRTRAPQQITEPPVVRVKIVGSEEIARCPTRNMAPVHWIPEHAVEECDSELRKEMKDHDEQAKEWKRQMIEELDKLIVLRREKKIRELRERYARRQTDGTHTG
jgi:hypothetical protein